MNCNGARHYLIAVRIKVHPIQVNRLRLGVKNIPQEDELAGLRSLFGFAVDGRER